MKWILRYGPSLLFGLFITLALALVMIAFERLILPLLIAALVALLWGIFIKRLF